MTICTMTPKMKDFKGLFIVRLVVSCTIRYLIKFGSIIMGLLIQVSNVFFIFFENVLNHWVRWLDILMCYGLFILLFTVNSESHGHLPMSFVVNCDYGNIIIYGSYINTLIRFRNGSIYL